MDVRIKVHPAALHKWKVGYNLYNAVEEELRNVVGIEIASMSIRSSSTKPIATALGIEPYNV